ncbi:MAG: DUF5996 family protein [Pseudomonadota bacterium]
MGNTWPSIPFGEWQDTSRALHLYCQVVGKYRLAHTPWLNHSWHATLYVTPRGLTTGLVHDPKTPLSLSFDFVEDRLVGEALGGARDGFDLQPMSVAQFLAETKDLIGRLGGTPTIHHSPNEIPNPVPFAADTATRPWQGDAVRRFHAALVNVERVFGHFRTGFLGKVSPVHLFWGSFDLAVTRFSGRTAPLHPGGIPALPDPITHEAYSHEVASAGFWPGGGGVEEAMFYAYAYPVPDDLATSPIRPAEAHFSPELGEFLLSYEAVRSAPDPDKALEDFLQSTYEAIAAAAKWDRASLDAPMGAPLIPRRVGAPQ